MGSFKCNFDGASKGNPGLSSRPFCIRNREENLIYAEIRRLFDGSNLVAEVVALRLGTQRLTYSNFQDIPSEARGIINTEKAKLPSLRIRRYQNGDFC
ncbi:hypothetical protein KY285_035433 [Solanum tuberosum]|nr:hypothetical protein KY284_035542 [Solanum tuberosum]KAH0638847.1 hypothetical protein KY285_035433 [Solanum tuberosum]